MDGYKKPEAVSSSSASSFTADLFGFKEPPPPSSSSSSGIFSSIFPPPSTVLSKKPPTWEVRSGYWQKQQSGNPVWNTKQATVSDAASYNMPNDNRNSIFQEERVEPCHLSSSIYYGGQDYYLQSPTTQTAVSYPIFKKDGGEEDGSHWASRGNWWQGSLYY